MAALLSEQARRVAEVLDGFTAELLPTDRFQRDREVMRLELTPLTPGHQVAVARAIAHQGPLSMLANGNLLVTGESWPLTTHLERRIARLPEVTYTVELRWSLDRPHPRIYCLSPVINRYTRPRNRHLYAAGSHPEGLADPLCVYGPHLQVWDPRMGDPAALVIQIAAYLARDAIQVATGRWLGPEASHRITDILADHGAGECWCGSGRQLTFCCGGRPIVSPPVQPGRRAPR